MMSMILIPGVQELVLPVLSMAEGDHFALQLSRLQPAETVLPFFLLSALESNHLSYALFRG